MTRQKSGKSAKAKGPSPRRQILEAMLDGPLSRLIIRQISDPEAQALHAEGLIHLGADYGTIMRAGRKWLEENR